MSISIAASYFIPICWVALFSYWLIAALRTKAVAEKQGIGGRVLVRVLVIGAYISVLSGWRDVPVLGLTVAPRSDATMLVGAIGCAIGVTVAIWARVVLAGNWSGNITFKQDHELIERGPYARVRHPIYSGIFLMFLGTVIAQGRLGHLLGLVLVMAAFTIKSRLEEALMLKHFPDQYAAYSARTKRLIPWVL